MGNKKKPAGKSYAVQEDKTIKKQSKMSLFAMFTTSERAAKTFLWSGLFMVIVGSYLINNPGFPRWLGIVIIVIGVIWNIIAGLLYLNIKNNRY